MYFHLMSGLSSVVGGAPGMGLCCWWAPLWDLALRVGSVLAAASVLLLLALCFSCPSSPVGSGPPSHPCLLVPPLPASSPTAPVNFLVCAQSCDAVLSRGCCREDLRGGPEGAIEFGRLGAASAVQCGALAGLSAERERERERLSLRLCALVAIAIDIAMPKRL